MGFKDSRLRWFEKSLLQRVGHRLGLFYPIAREECRWRFDPSAHDELIATFLDQYRSDRSNSLRSLYCVQLFWDDLVKIEAERMLRARGGLETLVVFDELLIHRIIMNFLWHERGSEVVDRLLPLAPRSDVYVRVGVPAEVAMSRVNERDCGTRDERQVVRYGELIDRALHHIGRNGADLIEIDGLMPPELAAERLADNLSLLARARQS